MTMTPTAGAATMAPSDARLHLANCIAAARDAATAQERAYAPARQLDHLRRAAERARARLAELRAEDDMRLADWLMRDHAAPRPSPSAELQQAESQAAELERDARAAATAIARMTPAQQAANARLTEASRRRALAAVAVAVKEAGEIAREFGRRLHAALGEEERLESLSAALWSITAGTTDPEIAGAAAGAAERVAVIRSTTRGAVGAIREPERARSFIDRLHSDPTARYYP